MTKTELEDLAARVVAEVLGGVATRRDGVPGAPEGIHDFDVVLPGGRVIALEVTSITRGAVRATWNAIRRHDWSAPTLRNHWSLTFREATAVIKRLRREVEVLLAQLESAGVLEFGMARSPQPPSAVAPTLQRLHAVGVVAGNAVAPAEPGRAVIGLGSTGAGSLSPDVVNAAVEMEAAANTDKLARASGHERHLWAWADWSRHDVVSSMNFPFLPDGVPALPPAIDTAWVATLPSAEARPGRPETIWRVSPPGPWENLTAG